MKWHRLGDRPRSSKRPACNIEVNAYMLEIQEVDIDEIKLEELCKRQECFGKPLKPKMRPIYPID